MSPSGGGSELALHLRSHRSWKESTMSVSAAAGTFSVQRGKGTPLVTPSDLPPAEHFIDGEFRSGSRGQTTDVVDPSNESTFARVVSGTTEDRSGQAGPRLRERV